MRFSVLASGSGGNSCYVETEHTRIIIDAGLSGREIIRRLERIEVDPDGIEALVITHEHSDHIKGAGPLSRRLNIPVYLNQATLQKGLKTLGNLPRAVILSTGQTAYIQDLSVETFTKCHDAADPVGLVLRCDGKSLGIITDLGRSTHVVEDRIRGCRALVIEFNHDERMLANGPYPLELKRRIKGPDGHLSNRQAGELLRNVVHKKLKTVVLAHLSDKNNLPEIALREADSALEKSGREGKGMRILIGQQDYPLPLFDL